MVSTDLTVALAFEMTCLHLIFLVLIHQSNASLKAAAAQKSCWNWAAAGQEVDFFFSQELAV